MQSTYDKELALEILNQIFGSIQKIKKRFGPIKETRRHVPHCSLALEIKFRQKSNREIERTSPLFPRICSFFTP
jgi:hypothetical protein